MMDTNKSGAMKTLLVVIAAFGGAFVGTLATRALVPAPALKASFGAAEKIEPAFKVKMSEEKFSADMSDDFAGEFIGGTDNMIELYQSGELGELIEKTKANMM